LAWRGVQDGSYSRGPISLLPDELAVTENYFAPPTFTIEQVFMDSKEILLLYLALVFWSMKESSGW
jgi:hypothetical protein